MTMSRAIRAGIYLSMPRLAVARSPSQMHGQGAGMSAGPVEEQFDRSTAGLPAAVAQREHVLQDGAVFELTAAPVSRRLAGRTVRMLAYNGTLPGPPLRVRPGGPRTVR